MPLYTPTLLKDSAYVPPSTAKAADDEFGDDSFDSAWTQVAPTGSATWTESRSLVSVKFASVVSGDMFCMLKPITISSGGYIETCMRHLAFNSSQFCMAGLVLANGTTNTSSAAAAFTWSGSSSTMTGVLLTGTITAMGSGGNIYAVTGPQIYTRLTWVSSNTWRQELSPDGISWSTFGVSDTSFTLTPTHMGLFVSNWGTTKESIASFEYFRASA